MSEPSSGFKLWGGRFSGQPSQIMEEINASIDFDQRMHRQDVRASRVHVRMLSQQGIVSEADCAAILRGLGEIEAEIDQGSFRFSKKLEDIHMHVEARLSELIGPAAGRLHTARSRNDQVAVDFRLWVRDAIDDTVVMIDSLLEALVEKAAKHADIVMPGFTHLQSAQPITFGHHCLAYVEMFRRDRGRFVDARKRLNECPLGSAALAGTSFPIDREWVARELGFDRPTANSLDSVSDRDFALEFMSACAVCAMHLSRFAEEIVLWSTSQFRFVRLSDAFTTGSSIMPQKRNPDAAELVRAKTGRMVGNLNTLLIVMKGLPLAYSKDMQEDKEPTFDSFDSLSLCLVAMAGMVNDMVVDVEHLRQAAGASYADATDLADWLVRKLGIPFREAHHIAGRLVQIAEAKGIPLEELSLDAFQSVDKRIGEEVRSVLGVDASVNSRTSFGGTAPERVRAAAEAARTRKST